MELAGVVESVGKDIKRFKEGDQVFAASLVGFDTFIISRQKTPT